MYAHKKIICALIVVGSIRATSKACAEMQQTAISDIVHMSASSHEAKERLAGIGSDNVISALVEALASDADFQDISVRGRAYQVLVDMGAEDSVMGRTQLLECLMEEKFRSICASALEDVRPEVQEEVVRALANAIQTTDQSTLSLIPVLHALGAHGSAAEAAAPSVENLFENESLEPKVRGAAARALSRIKGASYAIPVLLRDARAEVHLWPLAALDTDRNDSYVVDPSSQEALQSFVLKMMRSPDKRVREIAFESTLLAFEGDFVRGNATDGYFVNPDLRAAIEYMAEHDPDDDLRDRASAVAGTLDERLEKSIRRLERGKSSN